MGLARGRRTMPSQEDIANQQELLAAYRRTLAQLQKQQALIGAWAAPPAIANGIDETRASIRAIKQSLREWGITAEDLPGDEPAPPAALRGPWARRALLLGAGLAAVGLIVAAGATLLPRIFGQAQTLQSALSWSQCDVSPTWVLPGTIAPAQNPGDASRQIAQAIGTKQIEAWQVAGVDVDPTRTGERAANRRNLFMTVRGSGGSTINIHLFNRAAVTVTTQAAPSHVDVIVIRTVNIFDCPSGSGNRLVAPVELQNQAQQYTEDKQYAADEFLPLNSETSEVLAFPFTCRSPGSYTIQIGLRFRDNLRFQTSTYLSDKLATIVCPASFTFWPITYAAAAGAGPPAVQIGTPQPFHWDGERYAQGLN